MASHVETRDFIAGGIVAFLVGLCLFGWIKLQDPPEKEHETLPKPTRSQGISAGILWIIVFFLCACTLSHRLRHSGSKLADFINTMILAGNTSAKSHLKENLGFLRDNMKRLRPIPRLPMHLSST